MGGERPLRIVYFLEDSAHENFIPPLVERLADELHIMTERIPITPSGYSRGSRIFLHFRQFIHNANQRFNADLLIVCVDEDCAGPQVKRKQYQDEISKVPLVQSVIYAMPHPYIEYWYLANKPALSKALEVPSISYPLLKDKCDKDFYKNLLKKTCEDTGLETNGIEYGDAIVAALPLQHGMRNHPAKQFIEEARQALRQTCQSLAQRPD